MKLLQHIFGQASQTRTQYALVFLRIGIGILTIPHGYPKLMGGVAGWEKIGETFMFPLGIYFLPVMWGFVGACTEFFGGIALVLGLGTRIASVFLTVMMCIATAWHIQRGDVFNVYSFPLSLAVVYVAFIALGGGIFSLDHYLTKRK